VVSFAHAAAMQNHAFSVVCLGVWNGLRQELCLLPRSGTDSFLSFENLSFFSGLELGALLSIYLEESQYEFFNE